MKLVSRIGFTLLALLFACLPLAVAQTGLRVARIEIKHVGPPAASEEFIRSYIRVKAGEDYRPEISQSDVQNLYKTGLFYNIRVSDQITPEGAVLTYILQGMPRVTSIQYEGNKKYTDSRLRKKTKSKEGDPLDEQKLFADALEIQKMYQKAGYPRTEVKYVPNIDENTGRGTVTFQIKEGYKIKIKEVQFEGAEAFSERKLRKQIKTRDRWFMSWLTGSGVFKDDQFEDDKDRLREFYWNEGYIDFEIKDVQIEQPTERSMIIRFVIYEGRQYKVGAVSFKGNMLFTQEEIREGLKRLHESMGRKAELGPNSLVMDVGDTFTPKGLERNIEAVKDFYGARGYIDVSQSSRHLGVNRIPNVETGTMDLEFVIDAGQKTFIEKIDIKGNAVTKDRVIRRELAVSPGEVFDMVRVKLSEQRLEGLNYFEKVDMRPEPTEIPNRKNLTVAVEEKSTGNLTLGAGFSSVDSVVGFVEVSQGNFDLFKPPSFRGGGQKFRLRVQIGTERQDYVVSFIEPWFFGKKLAFGVDLYHRELNFQSEENLYDETRTGGRLSLTRALGSDFLIGSVSYGLEQVGIVDVDSANAVPSILAEEGHSIISRFGTSIAYDTRNSTLLPDKGQRTELVAEVAGGPFGGDKDFYKVELKTAWYFKGFFTGHVLEVIGRTGVAESFGGSSTVPFYERYYLGGIYSLRGFRYRAVGPREISATGIDEPVGGNTYWFGSAEYSIPIIERLRFAVFYDIGHVIAGSYDYHLSDYSDNWGVGLRLNLPIGPLRLDYGVPITHDDFNSGSGRFQFSVGYTREL